MNQTQEIIGLAITAILCITPPAITILAVLDWIRSRFGSTAQHRRLLYTAIAVDVIFAACLIDAFFIELGMLTATRINLKSPKVSTDAGDFRIIHISDFHFEKNTPLTRKLLAAVSKEHPDILCITGDIYQTDGYYEAEFKSFMTQLCDIAPTYFVCGYDDEDIVSDASSGKAISTDGKHIRLTIHDTNIEITGISENSLSNSLHPYSPESDLRIVLSHSPDRLDEVSKTGADLFLAGHTHGGQIRLPLWGAVMTNCETGKKYEYGLYKKDRLHAFITRGIGLEPKPAPRARFLCPPEIVIIEIHR